MERAKAHDVLHIWNGNKSENCPVCNGTLKDDAEIVNAAQDVAAQNYYPRVNPSLECDQMIMCDEQGNPIKLPSADAPVKAGDKVISNKSSGTINVMTNVMAFSEDSKTVPTRIKVVPVGKFKTQAYGEIEITKDKLLDMKSNYEKGVRAGGTQTGLPIDVEHGDSQYKNAAAGWMKTIYVEDDGAYADVEWTPLGKDLLESGQYKFYSPEFHFEYIDPEQSFTLDNVMTGGGLVNKPMFKHDLPPIVMSEDGSGQNLTNNSAQLMLFIPNDSQSSAEVPTIEQNTSLLTASEKEIQPMDLQTILTKEKSARTSDEQTFVATHLDELSTDQKVAEGFVVQPVATTVPAADVAPEAPAVPVETAPVAPVAPVVASENGAVVAAEVEALRARLEAAEEAAKKGALAFAENQELKKERERIQVTDKVKGFVFSEKGGKFPSAHIDGWAGLALKMGEADRAELFKLIEALPEKQIFGEQGSDEDLDKSKAGDILKAKISEKTGELLKANPALSFAEATRQASLTVVAESPELYKDSKQAVKAY